MDQKSRAIQLLSARQGGQPLAEQDLIAWCGAFVSGWQSKGMTDDERDGIVNEAWADFMEIAENRPEIPGEELYLELTRALWRAKKRWQRARDSGAKTNESLDASSDVAGSENPEELTITGQLLQLVLNKIFLAFESELPRLSERDRNLISRFYRLEAQLPPRAPSIRFPTPAAARKAVSRARRRLAEATDEWLQRDLENHPQDRLVIELAQEVVRGDRVLRVIDLLEESERDA